jgi:hypothetical protein
MERDLKKDKTIKCINIKSSQVLEIKPEKGYSIYYRFEMQPIGKISKIIIYCVK